MKEAMIRLWKGDTALFFGRNMTKECRCPLWVGDIILSAL
jgi:hypothetical protein